MSNIEKEPGFGPGVIDCVQPGSRVFSDDEQRSGVTVVRAHMIDGEITIVTNLEKDVANQNLRPAYAEISLCDLKENLIGDVPGEDDDIRKAAVGFLYIGSNDAHYNQLLSHFSFGYKKQSLDDAGKFSMHLYMQSKQLPDILFIDVPLQQDSLRSFCTNLKRNVLLANTPIVYSETQLTETQVEELAKLQLVDDIFLLNAPGIDYFTKALFLKQCKLYNHTMNFAKTTLTKKGSIRRRISLQLKRLTDIILAGLALILLSPVLCLVAVLIRIDSRGPVFYTALRAGKGFKVFRFYKFRSMVPNAEKVVEEMGHLNQYGSVEGPKFFKVSGDPRVTRFGKFIRNTSLDELPQLLNVLKGDMSIVGNRPLPLYEAVSLTTDEFVERFSAPAGITGLWQVNKRGKTEMSSEERISLDITYSRSHSFLFDLRIMAKTPVALLQKSDV